MRNRPTHEFSNLKLDKVTGGRLLTHVFGGYICIFAVFEILRSMLHVLFLLINVSEVKYLIESYYHLLSRVIVTLEDSDLVKTWRIIT